ncbi:hypothetical protein QU38_02295, partial [Staphylococcus aureus]
AERLSPAAATRALQYGILTGRAGRPRKDAARYGALPGKMGKQGFPRAPLPARTWRTCARRPRADVASSSVVAAPEIGGGIVLPLLDDRAADRAGTAEQLEQLVALAPADRALERGQVLGEALEHVEHRFLVRQEHVAPHGRVRGGDAREVAEAAGGVFDHFGLGDFLHV